MVSPTTWMYIYTIHYYKQVGRSGHVATAWLHIHRTGNGAYWACCTMQEWNTNATSKIAGKSHTFMGLLYINKKNQKILNYLTAVIYFIHTSKYTIQMGHVTDIHPTKD